MIFHGQIARNFYTKLRTVIAILSLLVVGIVNGSSVSAVLSVAPPLQEDVDRVGTWALENAPNDFAGTWFEGEGSDRLTYIAFARGANTYDSSIREFAQEPGKLRVVPVARSWNDLLALQAQIDADTSALQEDGIEITMTGIVASKNTVRVSVRHLSRRSVQFLKTRYGSDILLEESDYMQTRASRTTPTPPWPGAIWITGQCESTDCAIADCTSNFTTYQIINNVKYHHMLTAGHCFLIGSPITTFAGVVLGTVVQETWYNGTNADVEKFTLGPGTHSYNIITDEPQVKPVQDQRIIMNLGDSVCKSGIATDQTCGFVVTATNATVTMCIDPPACTTRWTIYGQMVADRTAPNGHNYGDSGGAVYSFTSSGVRAHGILSGGDVDAKKRIIYTFLQTALSRLGGGTALCMDWRC